MNSHMMSSGTSVGKVAFGQTKTVREEIIFVLFAQPFVVLFSNLGFISLYGYWLFWEIDQTLLSAWYLCTALIVVCRYVLGILYFKYQKLFSQRAWILAWTAFTFMLSLAYTYAFVALTPMNAPEFQIMVIAAVAMVSAATVVGYAASMYAIYCYIGPYSILTGVYFYSLDTNVSLVVSSYIVGFSIILILLMLEVSRVFV